MTPMSRSIINRKRRAVRKCESAPPYQESITIQTTFEADQNNENTNIMPKRTQTAEFIRKILVGFIITCITSFVILTISSTIINITQINFDKFTQGLNSTEFYQNKARQTNSDLENYFKNAGVDKNPIEITADDIQNVYQASIEPIFSDTYYDICADDNENFTNLKEKVSRGLEKFVTDNEIEINDTTRQIIEPVEMDIDSILCDNLSTEILAKAAWDENELKGNITQITITALVGAIVCGGFLYLLFNPGKIKSLKFVKHPKKKKRGQNIAKD